MRNTPPPLASNDLFGIVHQGNLRIYLKLFDMPAMKTSIQTITPTQEATINNEETNATFAQYRWSGVLRPLRARTSSVTAIMKASTEKTGTAKKSIPPTLLFS
jgi:hypothetical protein